MEVFFSYGQSHNTRCRGRHQDTGFLLSRGLPETSGGPLGDTGSWTRDGPLVYSSEALLNVLMFLNENSLMLGLQRKPRERTDIWNVLCCNFICFASTKNLQSHSFKLIETELLMQNCVNKILPLRC